MILVACEESGTVTKAFRGIGLEAFSCDLLSTSGELPEYHITGKIESIINYTWEMIIAFPPCTHLAVSGARWFAEKKADGSQQKAIDFFMMIANINCQYIAIENPVSIMSSVWRKPDQYIQPWQFGHGYTKKTGLWLKGLPLLKPTNIVTGRSDYIHKLPPSKDRAKLRSKTPAGLAEAMATQWGGIL